MPPPDAFSTTPCMTCATISQVKPLSCGPLPKVTVAEIAREKYLSEMAVQSVRDVPAESLAGVDLMAGNADVHISYLLILRGAAG